MKAFGKLLHNGYMIAVGFMWFLTTLEDLYKRDFISTLIDIAITCLIVATLVSPKSWSKMSTEKPLPCQSC